MEEVIFHSEIIYTHLGISLSPQNPLGYEPRSFHFVSMEVSLHDLNFMAGKSKIIGRGEK